MDSYSFGRTDRFTPDQKRFLDRVLYDFAEETVRSLAPLLQTRFKMELLSSKVRKYSSQIGALPDPTAITVFSLDNRIPGFFNLDFCLTLALFERLLGARSRSSISLQRAHLTELEKSILHIPLRNVLSSYQTAWDDIHSLEAHFQSLQFNPEAVYICAPSEPMLIASFQLTLAGREGLLEVCLPVRSLRKLLPKQSFERFLLGRSTPRPEQGRIFESSLYRARVPVAALLGSAEILFQDLLEVEIGDIVRLDTEIRAPLRVTVNGTPKFLARPGVLGGRMAARVLRLLPDQES